MEFRQLRYVVALVEHGHFGRAAASQGIKQPPLSQQIRQLEDELGVTLFRRSQHGAEPTEAGITLATYAGRILELRDEARRETIRSDRGESGHLVLGFLASSLSSILPRILAAFARDHPGIVLEPLEFLRSGDALGALARGDIDLTMCRPPLNPPAGSAPILALQLTRDTTNVILHARHRLAGDSSIAPRHLARDPFILTPLEERYPMYWKLICTSSGFEPRVAGHVQGIHTLMGMVSAGLGVGVAPSSVTRVAHPNIVIRPIRPAVTAPPLTLVWRADDDRPAVANLRETVRRELGVAGEGIPQRDYDAAYLHALHTDLTQLS